MLSIERIKELLEKKDMPDEEAREIRNGLHELAKVIYEKWREEKNTYQTNPNLNNQIDDIETDSNTFDVRQ